MEKCIVKVGMIVVVDILFVGAVGYTLIIVTTCNVPQLVCAFFTTIFLEEMTILITTCGKIRQSTISWLVIKKQH